MNIFATAVLVLQGILKINAATITFSSNPVTLDEEKPIGTVVATTSNDFGATEFEIIGGSSYFSIENKTGIIKTIVNVDFESSIPEPLILVIRARNTTVSDTQNLNISITDIDESPICTNSATDLTVSISETSRTGEFVHSFSAADPENSTLNYSILLRSTNGTATLFAINTVGVISTASALDYEAASQLKRYDAVVSVSDSGGNTCTGTVTIHITDANDEVPVISNCPSSPVLVDEEEPALTQVLHLSASDNDANDTLTFSFATPVSQFQIYANKNDAWITTNSLLDYDNASAIKSYQITVIVTDLAANIASCNLTVSLNPINEAPDCEAQFVAGTGPTVTIPETSVLGSTVYKLSASDPDGDYLFYSLLSTSSPNTTARFSVNNVGLITTAAALDFENGDTVFYAVVSITENTTASFSCTGTVTITVTDINDETPTISSCPSSTLSLNEEVAAETTLISLSASDNDYNDNMTFSFLANEPVFEIRQAGNTAIISNTLKLDYENASVVKFYTLNIIVRDLGGNTAMCNLNVSLNPINEAPECAANLIAGQSVNITETSTTGVFVHSFSASDPENDGLTYSILSTSTNGTATLFTINTVGVISTVSALDYDSAGQLKRYDAVVSVSDPGGETCTGTVIINIDDFNDEAPVISNCPSSPVSVDEEVPVTTQVLQLSASDSDDNDNLTFSFMTPVSDFQMYQVGNMAWIITNSLLDYDSASAIRSYQLSVIVTDLASNIAICNLTVNLNPINEAPNCEAQFVAGTGPAVTILETSAYGTSVYKLTASDPDQDTLRYSILSTSSINTTARFNVDNLGLITTSAALNFENGDKLFYAVISINDTATASLGCTGTVTIAITDVNDEAPTISSCPSSSLTLIEEVATGSTLITLSASDNDNNDTLVFSFAVIEPDFKIQQVEDSAIITNVFKLDYDNASAIRFYTLNTVVTDLGGNTAMCNLNISLIPVNEAPICDADFEAGIASVYINETHDVLTTIYKVIATDPDFEDSLTYEIVSQVSGPLIGGNVFSINSATGVIYRNISTSLDYDSGYHVFTLGITVKDKGNPAPQKSCEGTLTINIIDQNDEVPIVSFSPENPINFTEDNPIGTVVVQINSTDRDAGDVASYNFATASQDFSIDPVTGILTATNVLDYDNGTTLKLHSLQVFVTDKGFNTATVSLTIVLQPVNEPPVCTSPQLAEGTATVNIDENYSNLQSVYQVTATDPDAGDSMTFSIVSQDSSPVTGGNLFNIDPDTGIVYRNSTTVIDYDHTYHAMRENMKDFSAADFATFLSNFFTLKIEVTDKGNPAPQHSCKGTLTIIVNNLNDEVPVFVPIPSNTIQAQEEVLLGTLLGKVEVSDLDENDSVFFEFIDNQPLFSLVNDSGDIILQSRLDYDSPDVAQVHFLSIRAYDNNRTHSSTYTLTVSVVNIDEAPDCDPAFSVGAGVSLAIPENFPTSVSVYQILAADPDVTDSVTYTITDATSGTTQYFILDSGSGLISRTSISPLDYEAGIKRFQMKIVVAEAGKSSPKSCTGSVTINLENVNDESPQFMPILPNPLTIDENLAPRTFLIKVNATDKDVDDVIYYEFVKTHTGFLIEEDTGEIKTAFLLDYDDINTLTTSILEIRAYDSDRVHSSTATLTINIADVNDNPPQCSRYLYIMELAETSPEGTPVVSLNCWDNDKTAANNILNYSMVLDSYSTGRFNITGNEITVGSSLLQYDDSSFAAVHFQHLIIVKITDNGKPQLTSTARVIVKVTPVNERNPASGSRTFNVFEDSPIGSLIGTAIFTDGDLPADNVKYSIVGGNSEIPPMFYIESDSGRIRLLNSLDREKRETYILTVKATDMNNDLQIDPLRQRSSSAIVTVNVLNVNDEAPVCNPEYYESTIYSTITTPFVQLQCSDRDSPDNELSYSILGENTENLFELQRPDNNPPKVASTQQFQFGMFQGIEHSKEYTLLIQVTDEFGKDKHQQLTSTATVVIHVVPWTTTQPTTTVASTQFTTSVLSLTSFYWAPESWFVVMVTLAAALTVLVVSGIVWACVTRTPPVPNELRSILRP